MKIVSLDLRKKSINSPVIIYVFGDIHLGTKSCHEEYFKKSCEYASKDADIVIFNGDLLDFIPPKDRRIDLGLIPDKYLKKGNILTNQIEEFINIIKVFNLEKTKIFLIEGNHEEKIRRTLTIDPLQHISARLDLSGDNLVYGSLLLKLYLSPNNRGTDTHTKKIWRLNVAHGRFGGWYIGGKLNRFIYVSNRICEANVYVRGHSHDLFAIPITYLRDTRNNLLIEEIKYYCYSGSFYRAYYQEDGLANYVEKKDLPPASIGFLKISVWCRRKIINSEEILEVNNKVEALNCIDLFGYKP